MIPLSNTALIPYFIDRRWLGQGWWLLVLIGLLYMILPVVLLCYHFLVPALLVAKQRLRLSEEKAGALLVGPVCVMHSLLLVVLSFAVINPIYHLVHQPVLDTYKNDTVRSSLILFDTHPETAVSVVVFQLCIALAAVSFASKSTISLPRGQILRDLGHHFLAIIWQLIIILDYKVTWWESLLLMILYPSYVITMMFVCKASQDSQDLEGETEMQDVEGYSQAEKEKTSALEGRYLHPLFGGPQGSVGSKIVWFLGLPVMLPMSVTIPHAKNKRWANLWPVSLLMSLIWIFILLQILIDWWTYALFITLNLPHYVLDLLYTWTVSPLLISSIILSKQGYGRTAVSAVLGANVFYPTVVFAPSWFFAAFAEAENADYLLYGAELVESLIMSTIIAIIFTAMAFGLRRLTRPMGGIMIVLYITYAILDTLFAFRILEGLD